MSPDVEECGVYITRRRVGKKKYQSNKRWLMEVGDPPTSLLLFTVARGWAERRGLHGGWIGGWMGVESAVLPC